MPWQERTASTVPARDHAGAEASTATSRRSTPSSPSGRTSPRVLM